MKNSKILLAVFLIGCLVPKVFSGPLHLPINDEERLQDIQNEPEFVLDDEDEDSSAHNLERLASAATCLVAGVEYTHGQQIYRKDPCEFCLCLDGEMFCWWQDCPPVADGPCRDRRPFSPCANGVSSQTPSPPLFYQSTAVKTTNRLTTESTTTIENSYTTDNNSFSDISDSSTDTTVTKTKYETTTVQGTTTTASTSCTYMGKEYKIGEMLPHATGNCLECICGEKARVTCSPHQCAPLGDDSVDYRPPGSRPEIPDSF